LRFLLSLFSLLNLADLFLTLQLLQHTHGEVYEWNPVANWWLACFGWIGLVFFKLTIVLFSTGLFLVIARSRPRAGSRALLLACTLLAIVVLYSGYLLCALSLDADRSKGNDLREAQATTRYVEQNLRTMWEHRTLRDELGRDLLSGRCSLKEAVDQLALTARGQDPTWLRILHHTYPGYSDRECQAADFLNHTLRNHTNGSFREELARRFERDFRALFGSQLIGPRQIIPGSLELLLAQGSSFRGLEATSDSRETNHDGTILCASPRREMSKE
jgi:hypothetical protein